MAIFAEIFVDRLRCWGGEKTALSYAASCMSGVSRWEIVRSNRWQTRMLMTDLAFFKFSPMLHGAHLLDHSSSRRSIGQQNGRLVAGPKEVCGDSSCFSLIDSRSGRFLKNALATTFLLCIGKGVCSVAAPRKKSRAIFAVFWLSWPDLWEIVDPHLVWPP